MRLDFDDEREANAQSPFDRLARQMTPISGDGGVLKEVVQPGEGPAVPREASVSFFFSGFLEYADQPFNSTTHLKYPRMMKLGRDVTMAGLELGLLSMRKGEFSRFLFLPQYAFGEMGCPPLIPPAATILYEVHLLDFLDSATADSFVALSVEEQNALPLSTLTGVSDTLRSFGNRSFNQSRYDSAKDRYKQATSLLESRVTENAEEKRKVKEALLPIYMNLSLTELRLGRPHKALKHANAALDIDPNHTKALFRCGQAYLEMHDYEKAHDFLVMAQAKKPFDRDINNLLKKAAMLYKDSMDKQREVCSRMFKAFMSPMKK